MVSRYVTNGPVKQEGICLLPPTHYRMMPPQRADGFPVSTPAGYVPQPNQGANQGPGLRGIAPAVPPNQASTPPNADIKVQAIPQPASMSHMFVQSQVRTNQGPYFPRTAGPSSQSHRMPNHNNRQPQAIYGAAQTQFVPLTTMYIPQANVQFYSQPRSYVQQPIPMYPSHNMGSYQYSTTPSQPTPVNYYYNQQMLPRTGPIPQTQTPTPNPTQTPIPNMPLVPNTPQHQPFQRQQNKRRPNALAVIDPSTGTDRLREIFEQSSSPPPSGESSARQTPQPAPHSHNKEVQAAFAKQVMQAINTDNESVHMEEPSHNQEPAVDHIEPQPVYPPPPLPQAVQSTTARLDTIVQSSNLKVQAKEFFLPNSAKETPIVSANCDAVEVTLPNKSPKDRESPAKGRKQRAGEQQAAKEQQHREALTKEPVAAREPDRHPVPEQAPPTDQLTSSNNGATNLPQTPLPAKEGAAQEKKGQKKEGKADLRPIAVECDSAVSVSPPALPSPPLQDVSGNAKSKQNVQRVAQKQGLPQANNQKPAQTALPQPQPAKANNKSHKKNEINLKGANKEGTDMDAFNDNTTTEKEEVNANVNSNYTNNDIINANSIANNAPSTAKEVGINNSETNNKKIESNDVPTIKTEPVKPLKPKIDITDIVRDKPKPIKPFTATEAFDETDRVGNATEKMVQAMNEANAKVMENNGAEKSLYKEGQFSPSNPDGKRVYHRELLISLRYLPASRIKPDNIPESVLADDRGRLSDGRASMGGRTDFMNPPFTNYGGKSSSQRGAPPKRNSQSGKLGGGGQKSGRPTVKVSISVREDVKLHEAENAWRPARLAKGESSTNDDKKTEDLYKTVRGVLNKLTPQKFETLLSQIKALQIDTVERLQGVIDLVFEKAVDEPNFSVAYALMCKEVALMQVPTIHSTKENPDFVNFRKLLITRCQMEFEKQSKDESVRNDKVKDIEACTDPEKKKDLEFELAEHERRLRMKSVGTIRFIGELFKQNMLTTNIMMRCLHNLLENKDEESLECLCKLLTTVGKELDNNPNVVLSPIINAMKNIAENKDTKVSSRIRFMLQDVIDLRNSKWVPRRQDFNPKTMEQIVKDAENEHMNIQLMNTMPMMPRKDDRNTSGPNSDRKGGRGRNVSSDDGWITNTNRGRTQFTVQSDKLKSKAPQIDEPLGSSQMFGNWGKGSVGSNVKSQPLSLGANTANMYAALENITLEDKRPISKYSSRSGSKDPYNSKGPSLERGYMKYDGRGSRSGSQLRSNDSSASSSQRSTPAPMAPSVAPPKLQPAPPAPVPQLTEEQMERRVNNCLDEFITGSSSVNDYFVDISSVIPSSYFPRMVEDSYIRVLEKSQQARLKTGSLFAQLVKLGRIQLEDYCAGLEGILAQADDLRIDIPKIWDYLAEILVDLVCTDALPLGRLHKSFEVLISQGQGVLLLAPLFKLAIAEKGPNFLQHIWQKSGLQLTDFMSASQVEGFVRDNQFEFLVGGGAPVGHTRLTYELIESKLLEFLNSKTSLDDIVNWITANVGERVKENQFIKSLATAIFRDSINGHLKLVPETLTGHTNLLLKYVDNNPTYELQCLYALQALIHKLEHPQGLLLSICDKLYELGTFSQESFIAWESSTDPAEQEGKGVALKQLTCFFIQLKENDEEEYGSSTSDEA